MKTLEKLINKEDFHYVNENLTTENFPVPEKIQTEGWKIIRMNKSFSSKEAFGKIKSEGCRPANVHELITWANKHKEAEMPEDKWSAVLAFGSEWIDAAGDRRVPRVHRHSVGDFKFDFGYFECGWHGGNCLLCFCDESTQTLSTSETQTSVPLTLEQAIITCEQAGYTVSWKPRKGCQVYYFNSKGEVIQQRYEDTAKQNKRVEFGNCFPSKLLAEQKRDEVKGLLTK